MTDDKDDSQDEGRMTMIEHLTELRRRLIIAFISVGVGAVVAWIFYPQIIEFLLEPYCQTLDAGEECQLYVRNPLEPFSVRLTVAGYGGIILAMPMILWQFWAFIAPGLYSHEKRYALPFVWGGVALFFCGAGLAYWSIPRALEFLSEVGGDDFTSLFA
ncbi:MAG: twin-arginine translocase subunit TatC, partial [Actinomycetota bacterium]